MIERNGGSMEDMISRKALCEYALNQKDKSITPNDIMRFPSAQPEERTENTQKTHACDCISRKAAIDAIKTWGLIDGLAEGQAIEILADEEKLPSAQPERKTGRWIHDGYAFNGGIDWMHCSECGHKDSWSAATRTPFCAWCGARMEGEK